MDGAALLLERFACVAAYRRARPPSSRNDAETVSGPAPLGSGCCVAPSRPLKTGAKTCRSSCADHPCLALATSFPVGSSPRPIAFRAAHHGPIVPIFNIGGNIRQVSDASRLPAATARRRPDDGGRLVMPAFLVEGGSHAARGRQAAADRSSAMVQPAM